MERKDWQAVSLEELISYSKQKEVPAVSIIDDITDEEFQYVDMVAERLKIRILVVENTNKIAFVGTQLIAKKIALELGKRIQIMYVDFARRPSGSITIFGLTGYTNHWVTLRDNGYIVEANNEKGEEIEPWINTNIKEVEPIYLNSCNLSIYQVLIFLRNKSESGSVTILKHSRMNYVQGGVFNEDRKCYYPKDKLNYKNEAEYNKLEKLFRKWGFHQLY